MNKEITKLKSLEWQYCIVALAGIVIFLTIPIFAWQLGRTLYFILFFLALSMMIVGLTVAGKSRSEISSLEVYTKCPHCSGSGWVKKA